MRCLSSVAAGSLLYCIIYWYLKASVRRAARSDKRNFRTYASARQLRELEADGIITRMVYAEVPPRVEYALTDVGLSMREMLESISQWGMMHKVAVEAGVILPCSTQQAPVFEA